MKGITLTVEATDRLHGKIKVDLGESPTPIKNVARVFMLEVLEKNGMLLDEMKEWRLLSEAKAVVLEGRLTTKGLRTLTDLIPVPRANPRSQGSGVEGQRSDCCINELARTKIPRSRRRKSTSSTSASSSTISELRSGEPRKRNSLR